MNYEELLNLKAYYTEIAASREKQPAHPIEFKIQDKTHVVFTGMDILTVVATAAMKGILSNTALTQRGLTPGQVAIDAVNLAKALISEIEKSK